MEVVGLGGFPICHALPPAAGIRYATFHATFYATVSKRTLTATTGKKDSNPDLYERLMTSSEPSAPRRQVLFGDKPDWEPAIRQGLADTFNLTFMDLQSCEDLDQYDVVVPLTCPEIAHLSTHHPDLCPRKLLAPSIELLQLTDDKSLFNDFLRNHGYGNYLPGPAVAPPYLLKKRVDAWGMHTRIIPAGETVAFDPDSYFTQELVPGPIEYVTHILAKRGEIAFHHSFAYTFTQDRYVKSSACTPQAMHSMDTEHLPLFQSIITDLAFTGFCCFNFKVLDGVVKIFELNPRMGASLVNAIRPAMHSYLACLE